MIIKVDQAKVEAIQAETAAAEMKSLRLSFPQLLHGLVAEGWITEEEGTAWLNGTPPAAVLGLIATLPKEQQFLALARAKQPSEILYTDPLVQGLGAMTGKTSTDMLTFFRTYMEV